MNAQKAPIPAPAWPKLSLMQPWQFFDLCRKFWRSDKLDEWTKDIRAGRIPDFGGNLIY